MPTLERADAPMTVTPARGWLALAGIGLVIAGGTVWGFTGRVHDYLDGAGILHRRGGLFEVQTTAAGQITELLVNAGDSVTAGQPIARLAEPDPDPGAARTRMSNVRSPYTGRVDAGAVVRVGQPLVALERPDQQLDCYVFVPFAGKRIRPGMAVRVIPSGVSWEEYGYIAGKVSAVSDAPLSPVAMNVYLHNDTLVQQFSSRGAAYLVVVDLIEDPSTPSGFKWTGGAGPPLRFGSGTLVTTTTTLREQAPITLVVPALRRWIGF